MSATMRPARPSDLDLLAAMLAEFRAEAAYAPARERAAAALAELVADPKLGRTWLILHAGDPVGYVAVTFGFSLEHLGRDAFVDELFVRPRFRGSGLGTRVLEEVERECRALGVQTLHLEVERENRRGRALYRRRGFRDGGRLLLSKRLATDEAR